jgi:predicted dehydrogenase
MKLKFAVVGCGRIGSRHAKFCEEFGILSAVCDNDQEKSTELGRKYNTKSYVSIEDMLSNEKDLDVVSICTPNGLHSKHAILSLKSGCHVLCEKPMALTVQDCGEMINAAEKANRRLFIVKQNRFNPPVIAVKDLIDNGKLGKIFSIQLSCFWNRNWQYYENSWKGTMDMDGGTLFTQFSHFIDLLYWLIGDINEVHAYGENYAHKDIIDFEDSGVAVVKFHNGVIGTINYNVNSYEKNMEGSLTIFSEKGTIKIGGQYLNELEYQNIEGLNIEGLPEGNPPNQYGHYQGSMSNHDLVYKNLVEVLQNGGTISTNGFEGMKTVEIIEKIYKNFRA